MEERKGALTSLRSFLRRKKKNSKGGENITPEGGGKCGKFLLWMLRNALKGADKSKEINM